MVSYIFNRENPQNSEPQNGPRRGLDFIPLVQRCNYCLNPMRRQFGDRKILSPNSLRMGFTFLMDANTSKYFYNLFYGSEANSHNSLKISLELRD